MLWYFHHTRQTWWLTKSVPPHFQQKHHMRNAFYVPEYLYEFVLPLLLCTLHCTCSFCFDQLLQNYLQTFTCWNKILNPILSSSVLLWSQCVIWWHLRHVFCYLPNTCNTDVLISTVKDHLYHSLANKFWHWLTQTNLRLLAFRFGPLILSRIGVRIYKTYSVWQLLLQLLRKAKLMSEQRRFTVQWPEGVCKSPHVQWVSLSFSGQL